MPIVRNRPDASKFNLGLDLPYQLRIDDVRLAMQDVYDFFHDVNTGLVAKGLDRLDDTLRPAIMSGLLSDMITASLAKHSRTLTVNCYFNGHPDLVVRGVYAGLDFFLKSPRFHALMNSDQAKGLNMFIGATWPE